MSERATIEKGPVEGGIEYYTVVLPSGAREDGRQCARCGSSVAFRNCYECHGEGGYFGDEIAGGYDYGWIDEDEWYTCPTCRGKGGTLHCISGPEWCQAHPMPGREGIESTALPSEARDD